MSVIDSLKPSDGVCSLDTIQKLSLALDSPFNSYPCIHIAGTNGKGSTCLKIAKALEFSGYKVGLYTSPHLFEITERIGVNGVSIPEEELEALVKIIIDLGNTLGVVPTFFEAITMAAFCYFKKEKVEVAVIETGLGGRFDATNVITPILSIITSIGYDHMAILGNTLEEIAYQKAGIIKENVPALFGNEVRIQGPYYHLVGDFIDFDAHNSALAHEALKLIANAFTCKKDCIEKALALRPPCRFEVHENFILDVAHNLDGFKALLHKARVHFPDTRLRLIAGFSSDKEVLSILHFLDAKVEEIHFIETSAKKSLNLLALKEKSLCMNTTKTFFHNTFENALIDARELFEGKILVAGSFYIMSEVRSAMAALYRSFE